MNYLYRFRSFKFHFNIWPKIENNFFLILQGYLNSWFTVYRKKIGNFEDFEKKGQLLTKTRFFFQEWNSLFSSEMFIKCVDHRLGMKMRENPVVLTRKVPSKQINTINRDECLAWNLSSIGLCAMFDKSRVKCILIAGVVVHNRTWFNVLFRYLYEDVCR